MRRLGFKVCFVSIIRSAALMSLVVASPLAGSYPALGDCFANLDDFREANFGRHGSADDENIKISREDQWIWIIDKTPETNADWSLLEQKGSRLCYRAQLSGNSVQLNKERNAWLIRSVVAAIGLTEAKSGTYRMKFTDSYFVLSRCARLSVGGRSRLFPCDEWNN